MTRLSLFRLGALPADQADQSSMSVVFIPVFILTVMGIGITIVDCIGRGWLPSSMCCLCALPFLIG